MDFIDSHEVTNLELAKERLQLMEAKIELQEGLPHLYGWKFYPWARKFFDSTNRMNLISAANQISKSSIMIRKVIHWATAKDLWPKLWRRAPLTFIYGYPTRDVATVEFEKKWIPEFLPRGKFEKHPLYGWKAEYKNQQILALHFNSQVSVLFKTYAQDVQDLQTTTSWANFIDEELPEELYDELAFRLAATYGYWHGVFTPTLGQELWRCAMEEKGVYEKFPGACKQQISMYDCLYYDDETRSPWSIEQIETAERSCKSEAAKQRRIFGRFVVDEGLKYPSFQKARHFKKYHQIPQDWKVVVGVDPGSGGLDNHPAAIVFLGISPDYTKGRIFRGWRGDGIVTTASDIVRRVADMMKTMSNELLALKYDYSCRDFYTIAQEMGLTAEPAEKSHAIGEQVLNVLFRNDMLCVYDLPELEPLGIELATIKLKTPKTKCKDDFADALRYAVTAVPWDWSVLSEKPEAKEAKPLTETDERRAQVMGKTDGLIGVEQEMDSWNELYESGEMFAL